jgi:hypothetical protein
MSGRRRLEPDPLICNRALAAWLLSAQLTQAPVPWVRRPSAHVCQHDDGHRYAVVTSPRAGVLAVYRIHPDGRLVRLDRWPTGIGQHVRPASAQPA